MLFPLFVLFTAICLSSVSAYYSIMGLTAIFAAAYWPIVIMGGTLEVSKIVATLWLHYNWERADWKIKTYLVTAVCVLLLITSMGTFGFLAKAHQDQAIPSGDIQAQVQLFDEKITTEQDNIDVARKALTQMDAAVDQIMSRTDDINGATKATNLRRSQWRERKQVQSDIDASQKKIAAYQEERAPIASKFRKAEADVGPIKYIAALIYGDHPNQDTLEAAVRWVIILIVFVFDPLAIILFLVATTSLDWLSKDKHKKKMEKMQEAKEDAIIKEELEHIVHHTDEDSAEMVAAAAEKARLECEIEYERKLLDTVKDLETKINLDKKTDEILRNQIESQSIELASLIDRTEEELSITIGIKDKLASDLNTILNEYDEIMQQKEDAEEKLKEAEVIQVELVNEIQKIQSAYAEQEKILTAMAERTSGEYDDVLIQNKIFKEEVEKISAQHKAATEEVVAFKIQNEELANVGETTLARLNEAHKESELAQIKVKELENEIQSLRVDVKSSHEELLQRDKDHVEITRLTNDKERMEDAVAHSLKKQAELENEIQRLRSAVQDREDDRRLLGEANDKIEKIRLRDEETAKEAEAIKKQREEDAPVIEAQHQKNIEDFQKNQEPEPVKEKFVMPKMEAVPDNFPMGGNASFGVTFPHNPIKGDLFLRVDYMPSKLFKWVGSRWIEVDKTITDAYAYDKEYIKLLVEKVSSGEYDVDDLNEQERTQISQYLKDNS